MSAASDKRPSRKQTGSGAAEVRVDPAQKSQFPGSAPPLAAIMADRLRTAIGAIDSGFLYQNEALDVLAFTLTGLPSSVEREGAFAKALAVLEDVARPTPEVVLATVRGAA